MRITLRNCSCVARDFRSAKAFPALTVRETVSLGDASTPFQFAIPSKECVTRSKINS